MKTFAGYAVALLFIAHITLNAAPVPEGFYPFPLKWDDDKFGTPTDVSFLNHKPAGVHGRVVVRDGKFRTSDNDEVIRFIGIGIGGDGVFELDHDAAEKVAARLAKNGVNVVRFHNLDGDYARDSLIDFKQTGSCHFDAEHLDILDYFIAQLKKQGIYIVMGLKVNRTLLPADGAPEGTKLSKRTDRFSRAWIESQKEWARELLTHVNPYTGTTLAEDPAVVSVELNNESSLLFENLNWIANLHPDMMNELTSLWNEWLKQKYHSSDAELDAAWRQGTELPGDSLLNAGSKWWFEHKDNLDDIQRNPLPGDGASLEVKVKARNDQDWATQLQLPELTLEDGRDYTLEFEVSADRTADVRVVCTLDKNDWHNCGLDQPFSVGTDSRRYRFGFKAHSTERGHVRIAFCAGHAPGRIRISNITLRPGMKYDGLQGKSLRNGDVPLPLSGNTAQIRDRFEFMVDLDRRYADIMLDFLRDELKLQSLVIDTQIDWGGLAGLKREERMDYVDVHAYWGHPEFTGGSWEFKPGKWKIINEPQAPRLITGAWCPLEQFSRYKQSNKPLSISEHDYPCPNEYAVEMMPLLTCVALRQEWDMLHLFIHGTFKTRGDSEGISHMFDQTNHPGKIGFFPAAALIFRQGMFEPAERTLELSLPREPWFHFNNRFDRAWSLSGVRRDLLDSRSSISPTPLDTTEGVVKVTVNAVEDAPRPMRVWNEGERNFFTALADRCAVITGHWGGHPVEIGGFRIDAKPFPGNFGAAVLVARDGKSLAQSNDLLLTIGGRFENSGLIWNEERNSTLNESKTWGVPPVLATALDVAVTIPADGPRKVYALDNTGERISELPAKFQGGSLQFRILPEHHAMHYSIEAAK